MRPEYERNSPRMSSNSYVNLKIATCLVRYADDRLIDQRFPSAPKRTLTTLAAFSLKAEAPGGFGKLVTVPNSDLPNPDSVAGKVIGWAKLSDFDFQELHNCN
ncbi:hypothetical protein QZM76_28655 [Burkholderia multivorans]|nr:hypothetical protein [Burkholderia multivorans]